MKNVHTHPGFGLKLALLAAVLLLAINGLAQGEPAPVAEQGTCAVEAGATISLDDLVILTAGELSARNFPRVAQATQERTYSSVKELVIDASSLICLDFARNDFNSVKEILTLRGEKYFGKAIKLEDVYHHIICDTPFAENIDLIRLAIENPIVTKGSSRHLVKYFFRKAKRPDLLGKILMCRREFGLGCLDSFEHMDKKIGLVGKKGNGSTAEILGDFKKFLLRVLDGHLTRDAAFCRDFLKEPAHCR